MSRTLGLIALGVTACSSAATNGEEIGSSQQALGAFPAGYVLHQYNGTQRCLDVDGTKIDSYACTTGNNQKWAWGTNGNLRPLSSPDKTLDAPLNLPRGTQLQIWSQTQKVNQSWAFFGAIMGPGGKCLDVTDGKIENGTPVQLWNCNTNVQQQWWFDPGSWTLSVTNPNTGVAYCLEPRDGGQGAKLEIWQCLSYRGQQSWIPDWDNGWYTTGFGTTQCIDDYLDNTSDGNEIDGWGCNQTPAQKWHFYGEIVGSNGSEQGCVDLTSDDTTQGAKVQFWAPCASLSGLYGSGGHEEFWSYFPTPGG